MTFHSAHPGFFNSDDEETQINPLLQYMQHQSPEVLSMVARSASPDIKQIISHNVQGLVGVLPSEVFNVEITTDRDNLAGLLASAMMTGYFLRRMEQRMELESFANPTSLTSPTQDISESSEPES
ncbi:MAG: DUF760 domain-containing protein [Merismopedia sp. SIO2A8]|nr:DUF760 domain-containing protein [Symploca sp. SIO2B6]NET48555.1 DUF760 domain-containing protein [Merismopedia sp. SIO2A8]